MIHRPAHSRHRNLTLAALCIIAASELACGGAEPRPATGSGGAGQDTGGASATGGAGNGGTSEQGGSSSSGGTVGAGGASSGGVVASGGTATGGHGDGGRSGGAGGAGGAGGVAGAVGMGGQIMGSGGATGSGGLSGAGGAVAKTVSFAATPTTIVLQGSFATDTTAGAIALGDVDGDRRVDLVVQSAPLAAQVFLNNGGGQFFSTTPAATFQSGNGSTTTVSSLAVGDIDGDGKTDLAFSLTLGIGGGLPGPLEVLPFLNTGGGAASRFFASMPAATLQFGSMSADSTTSFALGDIDGDRKVDLAVVNAPSTVGPSAGTLTVSTYLNNGGGATAKFFATTAATSSTFPAQSQGGNTVAPSMGLGDVNGDGLTDIALLTSVDPNSGDVGVSFYLNNAGGAAAKFFATQPALLFQATGQAASVPSAIALGDVNGDGKADLAILGAATGDGATFDVFVYVNTSR